MQDTQEKLSKLTIALHWLVGVSMIMLMAVGWYMQSNKAYDLYPLHKSFGVIMFVFILVRVVWRLKQGFPEPVGPIEKLQHMAATVVHWVLLLGTLAFPISGMLMSGAGGHGISVFGIELLAANYSEAGSAIPLNETAAGLGASAHGILLWVMLGALALHVGGALKHHLVDKDRTLTRMLGK